MEREILIAPDGTTRWVWADELAPLIPALGGRARVARASHVEPTGEGLWTADMSPVGGPTLGPFRLRGEALAAEVRWLSDHGVPEPVVI